MRILTLSRLFLIIAVLFIVQLTITPMALPTATADQISKIKILGPNNDPNPVMNENKRIQLIAVDINGKPLTDATFQSGSPDIAQVDPQTGMVIGIQQIGRP